MFIKLEKRPECPMGQVLLTRGSAGGCPLHVHIDQALLSGIHSPYNLQLSSPCHSSPAPSRSLSLRPPLKLDCSPRNGQQYLVTKRPADVAPTFITSFNRTTRHSLYLPSFFLLPSSFFLLPSSFLRTTSCIRNCCKAFLTAYGDFSTKFILSTTCHPLQPPPLFLLYQSSFPPWLLNWSIAGPSSPAKP